MWSYQINSVEKAYRKAYPDKEKFDAAYDGVAHLCLISDGDLVAKIKYAASMTHPMTVRFDGRFYHVADGHETRAKFGLRSDDWIYTETNPTDNFLNIEGESCNAR